MKLELKTENENYAKSFSHVLRTFFKLAIIKKELRTNENNFE